MHTIPQNVTSYEDKIVGALIGRQFVYLAIGGITIFILLTTNVGPILIKIFLCIIIGAASAAMALLKINERGFDVWVLGFLKAVLGPTEWTWSKHELVMAALAEPDKVASANPTVPATEPAFDTVANRVRVDQFEQYLDHQRNDMDESEQNFVSSLDFSAPVPQSTFAAARTATPAPPMLTPNNPTPARKAQASAVAQLVLPQAKPMAALAESNLGPQMTISLNGKPQSISMLSNQRVNRSLSRHLLSGGILPLPVRGELHLSLSSDFQQELSGVLGYAPAGMTSATLASLAKKQDTIPSVTVPVQAAKVAAPTPTVMSISDSTPPTPTPTADPVPERQLPQAAPVNPPAAAPDPVRPEPEQMVAPSAPDPVTPLPAHDEDDLSRQLAAAEAEAQKALAELDQEHHSRDVLDQGESRQAALLADYQTEIQRLQQHNQEVAIKTLEAEKLLAQMQQELAAGSNLHGPAKMEDQQQLIGKLNDEQHRSESFIAELTRKLTSLQPQVQVDLAHESIEDLRPILNSSEAEPIVIQAPAPVAAPAPAPAPIATSVVPAQPIPADKMPPLSSSPNVINGIVLDSSAQLLPGVIVVVKDEQGEPKRALKTNKLGQFVITTPLSNGVYTVEVDKKGLAFDIIRVELTGAIMPPIEIKAKVR